MEIYAARLLFIQPLHVIIHVIGSQSERFGFGRNAGFFAGMPGTEKRRLVGATLKFNILK
jgi:hypothetical protein